MAMDGTAHASFGNLGPAFFSQGSTMRNDHGSISSQCLQYDGQHRAPADPQQRERNLDSNGSAPETSDRDSAVAPAVSTGDNYAQHFPDPGDVFTTNTSGDYAHYFPDSGNVFRTATDNNYAHYSPNPGEVFTTGDYAEFFPELDDSDHAREPSSRIRSIPH